MDDVSGREGEDIQTLVVSGNGVILIFLSAIFNPRQWSSELLFCLFI